MEEVKTMAQEIWKMSVLYPKTRKTLYHHIKISKKYNEHYSEVFKQGEQV